MSVPEVSPEAMRSLAVVARHGGELLHRCLVRAAEAGGTLDDLGDRVQIAGCDGPTVWVDEPECSIALEHSGFDKAACLCGEPDCPGVLMLDLVGIVARVDGRWWWAAMGPRYGADFPEETREDAKRIIVRAYAKAAG